MALNPEIALNVQTPDIGGGIMRLAQVKRQKGADQMAMQDRQIQTQAAQQQLQAGQMELDRARFEEGVMQAAAALPLLESGDIKGAQAVMSKFRNDLVSSNRSTADIDEAMQLLTTDPQQLTSVTRSVVEQGRNMGILQAPEQVEGFTLSEGQARFDAQGNEVASVEKAPEDKYQSEFGNLLQDQQTVITEYGQDSPQATAIREAIESKQRGEPVKISDVSGMRKEFTSLSGQFITMRDAFKKIQNVGDNAAGDLSLIFSFMKILDPSSVVREQEFANAQNAAGVPEQIRNQYNKILTGERLAPEQRERFKSEAGRTFSAQKQTQIQQEKIFRQIAERQGFNPDDVVVDFAGDLRDYDPNAVEVQDGDIYENPQTGEKVVLKGGQWRPL